MDRTRWSFKGYSCSLEGKQLRHRIYMTKNLICKEFCHESSAYNPIPRKSHSNKDTSVAVGMFESIREMVGGMKNTSRPLVSDSPRFWKMLLKETMQGIMGRGVGGFSICGGITSAENDCMVVGATEIKIGVACVHKKIGADGHIQRVCRKDEC